MQSESVRLAALQTAPFTSTAHQAKSSQSSLIFLFLFFKKKKRYEMQNMLFSSTFLLPLRIKSRAWVYQLLYG